MSLIQKYLLGVVLLCSFPALIAQNRLAGAYDLASSICAEWRFEYQELNGLKLAETTVNSVRMGNVVFLEDQTYLLRLNGQILERGHWDYNIFQRRIELKSGLEGTLKAIIQPLAPDRIVMIPILESGNSQKVFERLRYYYRRL
jgi:hypothetical protein